MRNIYSLFISVFVLISACDGPFSRTVEGNGNITTESRNISNAHKIECRGHFDVELTQGSSALMKITGDDNLLPLIITENNNGKLIIKTRDNVNLRSDEKIKIEITTDRLDGFSLAGSGDIRGTNKFTGSNDMEFEMAGAGSMHFDINTPDVKSSIAGTGDIYLSGETESAEINIAGAGNYHAENLKSENSSIEIAGTGDATLFADKTLDINIAGVGNVYYSGNPTVNQKIAGSGKIKKMD